VSYRWQVDECKQHMINVTTFYSLLFVMPSIASDGAGQ